MEKRGFQLSFSMIFSIIMIVFIIAIAIYAITSFLEIGEETELALYHQEFQNKINDVWASAITDVTETFKMPKGIRLVCFGNLSGNTYDTNYEEEYKNLKRYSSRFDQATTNRFLYPIEKAGEFAYKKVNKIDLTELGRKTDFECLEITQERKLVIKLVKDSYDPNVKLLKP